MIYLSKFKMDLSSMQDLFLLNPCKLLVFIAILVDQFNEDPHALTLGVCLFPNAPVMAG